MQMLGGPRYTSDILCRALPRSSWRVHHCVRGRHFNSRQPSGLNKLNLKGEDGGGGGGGGVVRRA